MSKEAERPPLLGRKRREGQGAGLPPNVGNLDAMRQQREKERAGAEHKTNLAARVGEVRTIIATLMQEPPWVDMKNLDIVTQIAVHKDTFHPGVPAERLLKKLTADESLIRASGPFVYTALLEALEERGLISPPAA